MKTSYDRLVIFAALFAASCATPGGNGGGGTVQVTYQAPEQFTDMGRNYSSARGADPGYLDELQRFVQDTGAHMIPAGWTLAVTISDVDMAGRFEPERGPNFQDVRMVRAIYPPRIRLTYRLTDPSGAVRSQGERRLTDLNFEMSLTPIDRDDPLRYEKELMRRFLSEMAGQTR